MSGVGTGIAIAGGIGAIGNIAGGIMGSSAASDAANAQVQAAKNANALQKYMYDQNRQDSAPWRTQGASATNYIARLLGVPGAAENSVSDLELPVKPQLSDYVKSAAYNATTLPNSAAKNKNNAKGLDAYNNAMTNYNNQMASYNAQVSAAKQPIDLTDTLRSTPGYQFTLDQGTQAIDRNAAASGRLNSGATLKALQTYGEGVADQTYENYMNRLYSLAGLGQASTTSLGNLGANAANNMSANTMAAGNAQASGYINSANAINGAISGVGNTINGGLQNYMLMKYLNG